MRVIAELSNNSQIATFYQLDWQVIPNLAMDIIVPPLARLVNVYLAGQIFLVAMFVIIISGVLVLNRALIGRFSVLPRLAIPLLYNYVFLVGLTNYIFGIGIAIWALAAWIVAREQAWPVRFGLSTGFVVALFFSHLSALGIYGIGLVSVEVLRVWQQRVDPWPRRFVHFLIAGVPFLAIVPLLYASPTMKLVAANSWEQRGKLDGLIYVIANYSDVAAFALVAILVTGAVWAIRQHVLRFHPLAIVLLSVGGVVYFALPRVMFDTYMTDQRVPLGVVFMLFACGDLDTRQRLVRRGFLIILVILIAGRILEIDYNWSQLSDSTSQFRSSVRRITPGSKVFVAYANASAGEDVRDLGLVHAACIATIER